MSLDNIRLLVDQLTALINFDQGTRWEDVGIEAKIDRLRQATVSQMYLIKLQAETLAEMQQAITQMQETRRPMDGLRTRGSTT